MVTCLSGFGIKDPCATQFAGDDLLLFPRQAGRGSDSIDTKSVRVLARFNTGNQETNSGAPHIRNTKQTEGYY